MSSANGTSTKGTSNGRADTAPVPPPQQAAPAWRLYALRASPAPFDNAGRGEQAGEYAIDVLSARSIGETILVECRQAADTARLPLIELERELETTQARQRLRRLEAALQQARSELSEAEKTAKQSFRLARQAIADGSSPEKHEATAVEAQQRQVLLRNRIEGLQGAIAPAQLIADQERHQALFAKRLELRRELLDSYRQAEADFLEAIQTYLPPVLKADAAVRAIVLTAEDGAELMAAEEAARAKEAESKDRAGVQAQALASMQSCGTG